MALSRRGMLWSLGGGALALTAGAAGITVLTSDPAGARAAWRLAGQGYADPRLAALSWAILAPNPHNRQPWTAELIGDDAVLLRCRLDRRLPDTDPFDRQTVIGFGAFIELFRMAAAEAGLRVEAISFPAGVPQPRLDARPVAHLRLIKDAGVARDPLFRFARERRSNKQPYDTARPVQPKSLATLVAAAGAEARASAAPEHVAKLRDLSYRAALVEIGTPRTMLESVRLMRIGRAEVEANPDGIAVAGAMPELLHRTGLLTKAALADPSSRAVAWTRDMYRANTDSAMAHIWITTPTNDRAAQLGAGRDWLRVNLAATAAGLAVHPLSQALQEFPEMAGCYRELHALLAPDGGRVQMLGRVGYAPPPDPSPRWPLETHLVRA